MTYLNLIKKIWLTKKARRMTARLNKKVKAYPYHISVAIKMNPTILADARKIDMVLDRVDELSGDPRNYTVVGMIRNLAAET
ncbi:hypothetical protein R2R70_02515 [Cobetia sp. SIMBA_158]|uniref:hypothetical protein n=1 Tax=Cobetia sp. SIMBA_158 TaxID=3081617 RepID=UPI003980D43F